jgi:hypothetical protein
MEITLIPSYRDLFGEPTKTYSEFVEKIPSEVIISILITFNNELNANVIELDNQKRLIKHLSERFSPEQSDILNKSFINYSNSNKILED